MRNCIIRNDKKIVYMINAPYRESSLGIDIEDPVEKEYSKKINGCKMDIVLYKVEKDNESRCVLDLNTII